MVDGLVVWLADRPPSRVLVYLSMPGELPAERVVSLCEDRHRFFVTRTPPSGPLTVHGFDAPRERHIFGFEQPVPEAPEVAPRTIDIVLTPGLCFDRSGGRIGWGQGYYDRLLALVRPEALRVGVTLDRLVVDEVPMEAHDLRMSHLATERGVSGVVTA